MERISVVIPAFNAARFITRALASLESQTLGPSEVVVVDDGSNDETHLLVSEFAATSSFNVLLVRQANRGSATARNSGIRASSGDLIAFMDADDLMYPRFLERTVAALKRHSDWVACFSDRDVVDAQGQLLAKDLDHPEFKAISKKQVEDGFFELDDAALFSRILPGSVIPMTIVCRRDAVEAVGGFDEAIRFHEDRLFLLELIKLGGKFGYAAESLGIWQRHDSNKTGAGNSLRGIESSDLILQKVLDSSVRLHLSTGELEALRSARERLAEGWIYASSRAGAGRTLSLGTRLLYHGRISLRCFLRAVARYLVNATRR